MFNAVVHGKLVRQPCRDCGVLKVEGHHYDYNCPLDVIWLCHKHHKAEHVRLRREGIEVPGREHAPIGFRFTEQDHKLIDALKAKMGLQSTSDLVRHGLRVLAEKEGVTA
jgi:hypothetical protein